MGDFISLCINPSPSACQMGGRGRWRYEREREGCIPTTVPQFPFAVTVSRWIPSTTCLTDSSVARKIRRVESSYGFRLAAL